MKNLNYLFLVVLLFCSAHGFAAATNTNPTIKKNPVKEKVKTEEKIPPNYFAIAFYKPTYILPYYYTGSPDNQVYTNNTPNNEKLKHAEVKYQFSVKVPAWKNILNHPTTLYFAYTQLSYWQLYNHSAFFRETDYEPELFIANEINKHLFHEWALSFLNVGAVHQSNGYGNSLERSWNRVYVEAIASTDNWMISVKPWYVFHDGSFNDHNPNITDYLGYGRLLISYKNDKQVLAVSIYNAIESQGKRPSAEVTWSFPLTPYVKGYVQLFSGYGQSLIEYNHHTNSAGVGIAFSDWV